VLAVRPSVLVLLALAGIIVVGSPGPWPFGHGAGQADVNLGPGDHFTPTAITVHEGDVVTWHFDGNKHTVTSTGGPGQAWDSGSQSTGTFSHTFDRAGTYPYICALHAKMTGTVVVLPPDATTPPPSPVTTPAASTPAPGSTAGAGQPGASAPSAVAPSAAAAQPSAPAAGGPAAAAPPRIAALHLTVPRGCRRGHCRAVATLTASEPGTVTARAATRRLLVAPVVAGRQHLRIPLDRVRRGRVRVSFVLADAAGNRSSVVSRTVTVR
jgi:hypothetical protein